MVCVTSVSFNFNLNGQEDREIPFLLLFVLSMEYLSRLFDNASNQHHFKYHLHCKAQRLTHVLFVDDLIIFCKAYQASLKHLMHAFCLFSHCSSLAANLAKSQIVFEGCNSQLQQLSIKVTGIKVGSLAFRYLGCLLLVAS